MKNLKNSTVIQTLIFISFLFLALGSATTEESTIDKAKQEKELADALEAEKKTMESWIGSTKAQLIQKWGPPTRKTDDGQGGEILIYEITIRLSQQAGYSVTPSYPNNTNYPQYTVYTKPETNSLTRSRMFYVNEKGIIYHWLLDAKTGN